MKGLNNLCMKFSAFNADFSSPSADHLGLTFFPFIKIFKNHPAAFIKFCKNTQFQ